MIIFIDQRLILLCTISVFIHCVKVDLFFDFPDAMMMSAPDSMKVWRKWRLSSNKRSLHKTEWGAQRLHVTHRVHMSVGQKCSFKKYNPIANKFPTFRTDPRKKMIILITHMSRFCQIMAYSWMGLALKMSIKQQKMERMEPMEQFVKTNLSFYRHVAASWQSSDAKLTGILCGAGGEVLCVINSVLLTECSIEINWIMVQNYTFKP